MNQWRVAALAWQNRGEWKHRVRTAGKWLTLAAFASGCGAAVALAGVYLYLNPQLPDADSYRNYVHERPMRVFSADGALLAEYGTRRLIPIVLEDAPRYYVEGLIATEDHRFYSHGGIDWLSLANDFMALLTNPEVRRGASTITMQLPRNIGDLSRERTFIRKFKEMLLALKIEGELTKDEILELYINVVPFGKQSYGVQAASFTYYGKPASELNLAQLAMLAGISKRPEAANPINGPELAIERRNLVLRRMLSHGIINRVAFENARSQPISARVNQRELDLDSPYPSEIVRQILLKKFGREVYSGYNAYTTIVESRQKAAQDAVRSVLLSYDRRYGWRGAEGQIDVDANAPLEPQLVGGLKRWNRVANLEPVAVSEVSDKKIKVLDRAGRVRTIEWEGIRWARAFRGIDVYSPRPKNAGEVVSVGDIVRIGEAAEGAWHLAQIPEVQGALVALDPSDGEITALVGGFDFGTQQFNHATQGNRQPGSSFKPFVYSSALANGKSPASIYLDAPLRYDLEDSPEAYRPRNDSMRYNGPTRLREALYRSINLVSMRVVADIGNEAVQKHAALFGFDPDALPRDSQLAIGGGTMQVTPLQMAAAYAVFANGGFKVEPHLITRVEDHLGNVVHEPVHTRVCNPCTQTRLDVDAIIPLADTESELSIRGVAQGESEQVNSPPAERVLDERHAFLIDSMLRDVVRRGTGSRARQLGRTDLAGKTGTTNEAIDTWFNGYHPTVATSAWVGYSNRKSLGENEWGATRPLDIWMKFMSVALDGVKDAPLVPPVGIIQVRIDPETGTLAEPGQDRAVFEFLREEDVLVVTRATESDASPEVNIEEIF